MVLILMMTAYASKNARTEATTNASKTLVATRHREEKERKGSEMGHSDNIYKRQTARRESTSDGTSAMVITLKLCDVLYVTGFSA